MYCKCGQKINPARLAVGYFICIECGREKAKEEIRNKSRRIGVAYNKGSYQYLTSKQMVKDAGKK